MVTLVRGSCGNCNVWQFYPQRNAESKFICACTSKCCTDRAILLLKLHRTQLPQYWSAEDES